MKYFEAGWLCEKSLGRHCPGASFSPNYGANTRYWKSPQKVNNAVKVWRSLQKCGDCLCRFWFDQSFVVSSFCWFQFHKTLYFSSIISSSSFIFFSKNANNKKQSKGRLMLQKISCVSSEVFREITVFFGLLTLIHMCLTFVFGSFPRYGSSGFFW